MIVPEGFLQVVTLQMTLKSRPIGFTMGNSCSRNSEAGESVLRGECGVSGTQEVLGCLGLGIYGKELSSFPLAWFLLER